MDIARASEHKNSLTIRGVSTVVIEAPMRFIVNVAAP